jgi:hypothetical protein
MRHLASFSPTAPSQHNIWRGSRVPGIYIGGTSSLLIQPRAFDPKRSVGTCASYTRPQLVHLSVRYSNPERIGTTFWTVGWARHFGQRGRPSGAVDATGSSGGASINPIARPPRDAGNPLVTSLVPGRERRQLNCLARCASRLSQCGSGRSKVGGWLRNHALHY